MIQILNFSFIQVTPETRDFPRVIRPQTSSAILKHVGLLCLIKNVMD